LAAQLGRLASGLVARLHGGASDAACGGRQRQVRRSQPKLTIRPRYRSGKGRGGTREHGECGSGLGESTRVGKRHTTMNGVTHTHTHTHTEKERERERERSGWIGPSPSSVASRCLVGEERRSIGGEARAGYSGEESPRR